jgi:hypothetical protein
MAQTLLPAASAEQANDFPTLIRCEFNPRPGTAGPPRHDAMQIAGEVAAQQVPPILSHPRLNISDQSLTQLTVPVFLIDSGQHIDLS